VEKFVALSKNDLARRLGIEADRITLVKTTEMLWLNIPLGSRAREYSTHRGVSRAFRSGLSWRGLNMYTIRISTARWCYARNWTRMSQI